MTVCRFCKYPREGLDDDAPCPECGRLPIATLPPLADESQAHRRRLASGARLAQLACGLRVTHGGSLAVLAFTTDQAFWFALWLGLAAIASVNALAAFRLTAKGNASFRSWSRPTLRAVASLDIAIAVGGGIAHLATRDAPTAHLAVAIAAPAALLVTWAVRSLAWVAITRSLAPRLDSDRLTSRTNAWLTYAGVAAMTSVAGFIAAALTALVPILAPITVVLAAPYGAVMLVLGTIALVGTISLHGTLARELATAAG
ncbi:MAG: hypothetical protein AAFN41_12700 [Planctomycetota bacterium]